MPFTDAGKFYHDRRIDHAADTWKLSAEKLARDVETFLYAEKDPGYMHYEFLAWAISRYDATKQASGTVEEGLAWDPSPAAVDMLKLQPHLEGRDPDRAVRFDANAHASPTIDTDIDRAADDGFAGGNA